MVIRPNLYAYICVVIGFASAFGGLAARANRFIYPIFKENRHRERLRAARQRASDEWLNAGKAREEAEIRLDFIARKGLLDAYASGQARLWESRERLGEVTEIRQAFAKLSSIITHGLRVKDNDEVNDATVPPIDRVIVYIDDLDQCAPELVVRVLEAIKLLMDVEHFVVIVGVDSRWLFRSLEIKFKALFSDYRSSVFEEEWLATPQNYLEKIFQLSLMLPPMTREGYDRLIRALFVSERETQDAQDTSRTQLEQSKNATEKQSTTGDAAAGTTSGAIADDKDDNLSDLVLRAEEFEMLQALAPLIQTPRSAKRLTNIYRLLRVSEGESRLLENNSYRVILLLLSVIVGYPRQSSVVLSAIERSDPAMEWEEFITTLVSAPRVNPQADPDRNEFRKDASPREDLEWMRMTEDLMAVRFATASSLRIADFRRWLQSVAGYTFHPWMRVEERKTDQ